MKNIYLVLAFTFLLVQCGTDSTTSSSGTQTFAAVLNGSQEATAVTTSASGTGSVTINTSTNVISGSISTSGITGTSSHIHDGDIGSSGSVVVTLTETPSGSGTWVIPDGTTLTSAQASELTAGGYYFNVHSAANASGEIRGQIMSYAQNIQSIWTGSCTVCHNSSGSASFLNLASGSSYSNLVGVAATASSGTRVVANSSSTSVLYNRITGNGLTLMPLGGSALSTNNQNLIRLWIDTGAPNN